MSEAFARIARLQLERLRWFASQVEAGEADASVVRQARERLRRFVLAAQESAGPAVRATLEEVESNLASVAERGSEGAAWLGDRVAAIETALEAGGAAPAGPPRRPIALLADSPAVREEPADPVLERIRIELEDGAREARALGATALAARLGRAAGDLADWTAGASLVPLATTIDRVLEIGHRAAKDLDRSVSWVVTGRGIAVERDVASWLEGHLGHLVANALQHGLEPPETRREGKKPVEGRIWIAVELVRGGLAVDVTDDGRGLAEGGATAEAVFRTGGSRPGGLPSLAAETRSRGGDVLARSERGAGTQVGIRVPVRRARLEGILVDAGGEFALPADRVRDVAGAGVDARDLADLLWSGPRAPERRATVRLETASGPLTIGVGRLGPRRSILVHPIHLPSPTAVAAVFRAEGGLGYFLDADALAEAART